MSRKVNKFFVVVAAVQIVLIVLFAVFVRYGPDSDASLPRHSISAAKGGDDPDKNSIGKYYPMFQDVHVMMFVGFGFLMTFLKKYGFSSVGINFLIAALVLQWATFMQGLHASHYHRPINVDIVSLLGADFSSATILISFGAVLGKTSPLQLIVMAIVEVAIFTSNEHLGLHTFKAVDVGGSMFVHVFGAYFGLSVSVMLFKRHQRDNDKNGSNYQSDIFAMIGTIFLWLFWPSFNSALAAGDARHRAVMNTYYSLAACCVVSFAFSSLVTKKKFDMVHVQNATLAGGVAIGTAADMMVQPFGALIIGSVAGVLSVLGYRYLTPFLEQKLRIHDTCGVNNLHGMPGILAGFIGAILAYMATEDDYGKTLYKVFPARVPEMTNSTLYRAIETAYGEVELGLGRSSSQQAIYQLVALGVTLLVAIVGGIITGALLRLSVFDPPEDEELFDDERNWEVPEEEGLLEKHLNGFVDKDEKADINNSHTIDEITKV